MSKFTTQNSGSLLNSLNLPPLRHTAEPWDAGGLKADVGIEATGDGAMDNRLLLLA